MEFWDFAEKWMAGRTFDGAPAIDAPEEIECFECGGRGTLEQQVPLQEALSEIERVS